MSSIIDFFKKRKSARFRCKINDLDTYSLMIENGQLDPAGKSELARHAPALEVHFHESQLEIFLPPQFKLDKPLQIIHLSSRSQDKPLVMKMKVKMDAYSTLNLIHCTDSDAEAKVEIQCFSDFDLGEFSHLNYYAMQNLNDRCKLENSLCIHQKKSSTLNTFSMVFNGGLIRNSQDVYLEEEQANANLYGFNISDQNQEVENFVKIWHKHSNCRSEQAFKAILDDAAKSYFKGHIYVSKDSQGTEAFQNCRNLLLSPKAKCVTKPFLEIYADDVKCSHGATTGQLDENALFYLQSRGIGIIQARRLLMEAFAAEILSKVEIKPLRISLENVISRRLAGQLKACDQCVLHCEPETKIC